MCEHIKKTSYDYQSLYKICQEQSQKGMYMSYIRGKECAIEHNFLYALGLSFQCPWYFAPNWESAEQCLCDLDWLHFDGIFIAIDDFTKSYWATDIFQEQWHEVVIGHLRYIVEYWQKKNVPIEIWLNN